MARLVNCSNQDKDNDIEEFLLTPMQFNTAFKIALILNDAHVYGSNRYIKVVDNDYKLYNAMEERNNQLPEFLKQQA